MLGCTAGKWEASKIEPLLRTQGARKHGSWRGQYQVRLNTDPSHPVLKSTVLYVENTHLNNVQMMSFLHYSSSQLTFFDSQILITHQNNDTLRLPGHICPRIVQWNWMTNVRTSSILHLKQVTKYAPDVAGTDSRVRIMQPPQHVLQECIASVMRPP